MTAISTEELERMDARLRGDEAIPNRNEVADFIAAIGGDTITLRTRVLELEAALKGMRALLRTGCDLLAEESDALRSGISIGDVLSDDPEDAPTIAAINEIEDWIASVKETLFPRAALNQTGGAT